MSSEKQELQEQIDKLLEDLKKVIENPAVDNAKLTITIKKPNKK